MRSGESPESYDNTDLRLLYERIYKWHKVNKHKSKLLTKLRNKYLDLVQDLPDPNDASVEDISFVCIDINDGKMAWSRDEKDDFGNKMVDYARQAIEKLGGNDLAFGLAEKSQLAWKYWPRMSTLHKVLRQLSAEDLRQLYTPYQKEPKISDKVTKSFILRKVLEGVPSDHLFRDLKVSSMLSADFEELCSFFKSRILSLNKSDIDRICDDLEQSALAKKYKSKEKLVEKLFEKIPVHKILRSRALQKKLNKKPTLKVDIRRIELAIKALSRDFKQLQKRDSESLRHIEDLQLRIQQLSRQQGELATFLSMKTSPDALALLENFRRELISLDKPMSPQKLCEVINKVKSQLNVDELSFTLKGLEILLSLYLLQQVKSLQWPSDFQEFISVVRQEIPKIQILPNQAEIPALRKRVTERLDLSDSVFDRQLVKAWKEGYVKLDVGAPIGRNNVKYLRVGQNEYFYVKLLRG